MLISQTLLSIYNIATIQKIMQTENLKKTWDSRQKKFGNTNRSVLLKNLPDLLNNSIHKKHLKFILNEINSNYTAMLDVGCGWGRISKDIIISNPNLCIEGVELSNGYADHFNKTVGHCFLGPVQDFNPQKKYDIIIFITVLMYLKHNERQPILQKMWQALKIDGKMICIEPSMNCLTTIRKTFNVKKFQPTGEDVKYFSLKDMMDVFSQLDGVKILREKKIGLLPYLNFPTVHRALSVTKIF